MPTFTWTPDQGASRTKKPRINKTQFGDGYAQVVPEGVNTIAETWNISFTLRRKGEIQSIDSFLSTMNGVSKFTWTTPFGDTLEFVCEEWQADISHDYDSSLTATFQQRY